MLEDAITNARKVYSDSNATQKDIDVQEKALKGALKQKGDEQGKKMSDLYEIEIKELHVKVGEEPDYTKGVNLDKLPKGTKVDAVKKLSKEELNKKGTYEVKLAVLFSDGSIKEVTGKVVVGDGKSLPKTGDPISLAGVSLISGIGAIAGALSLNRRQA